MGSNILITGAGRRIGLRLAEDLIEEGYDVIVHYHNRTEAIDRFEEDGVTVLQGDFDYDEGITSFIEELKDSVFSLSGIIHNASMYTSTPDDPAKAIKRYDRFYNVHMKAPYLINDRLEDLLIKSDRSPADIIVLTDIYADHPEPEIDLYSSTKAGLKNLVNSGARKFAPDVKVNAIAPGPVLFEEDSDEQYRDRVLDKTPMSREGRPDSISGVVTMILEHDFMTGAHIPVDGGRRFN